MKLLYTLYVMLISSICYGQIQPGNNPNFVPEQPAAVGDPTAYGYQNRVVARWVSPQFETINQPTRVGLLAYHFTDIAKVDFQLNGGPVYSVFEKTMHENINGYWLDIGPLPDAEKNVLTAVIYPNSGTPFILGRGTIKSRPQYAPFVDTLRNATWKFTAMGVEPLQFASDFNNTLSKPVVYVATWGNDANPGTEALPKKTLYNAMVSKSINGNLDGITIYLSEGDHAWAAQYWAGYHGNKYRYVTVKNHPNNQVPARIGYIGNGAGFRTNRVKLEGLVIQHAAGPNAAAIMTTTSSPMQYWEEGQALRLVNCKVDNWTATFNQNTGMAGGGWDHVEAFDCTISNLWSGFAGVMIRCDIENIESDISGKGALIVTSTFKNYGNVGCNSGLQNCTEAHPDLLQWFSGFEPNVDFGTTNTILYKWRPKDRFDPIWSQGIFGQGAVDVVIDDVVFQGGRVGSYEPSTSWMRGLHITESYNVMIRNTNIGSNWTSGIGKMPNYGPHTALIQNLKQIKWNYTTQDPVWYGTTIDGKWLMSAHQAEYVSAGKPNIYDAIGVDYATEFEPRLGPVGVRYDFEWTDPDLFYNAKDLSSVLANWGLLGVGAEGDYNKDGYVDAQDLSYIFSKWHK